MIDPTRFDVLHVSTSHEGAIVHLVLDHGKANEIGSAELRELELLSRLLSRDRVARALVTRSTKTTSKGTPIFVAGANVTERAGWGDHKVKDHVRWQREVLGALAEAPIFHVVVVDGVAFGWGTEFLLTADYRIVSDGARFALPETSLGIVPGAWGTARLALDIGLPQALRMGMTGETLDAAEATRVGLVQEHVPDPAAARARAVALAERVLLRSPTAVGAFKRAARMAAADPSDGALHEARAYAHCVDTGEAAIGRASFGATADGARPAWGPRRPLS